MKRALSIALLCALLAGSAGYVFQRVAFGPTALEQDYARRMHAARAAGDQGEYQRLAGELSITVTPRELAFAFGPPVLILGGFAFWAYRRRSPDGRHGEGIRRDAVDV
jgi:hypothetical protein